MTVASVEQIIDSDNAASRCGCPSVDAANKWTVEIFRVGDWLLAGECSICGAAWEWGRTCAGTPEDGP